MFSILENLCLEDINKHYTELIEEIKTEEGLKRVSTWYNKTYTKNPQQKLTKFLNGKKEKEIETILHKLTSIANAPDFKEDFVITLEWTKNNTWGWLPKVFTNIGFEYRNISGCGYDKTSTATAYALNSNLSIMKLLYQKKEKLLNEILQDKNNTLTGYKNEFNEPYLGYGSGYSILPHFEGGVGINSHEHILNGIGLTLNHISDTKASDVFVIKKQI